jgi:hypothetical protein
MNLISQCELKINHKEFICEICAVQSKGGLKCDYTLVASFENDLHQSLWLHNYPSVNMQYLYYESVDFNKI